MDIFQALPLQKRDYMEHLFRNCTEEVRYYMSLVEIEADRTFITAGTDCTHIFIILSGKVTGVEWPMDARAYPFKDFGPGDFFGEIECFAGLAQYRISIVSSTKCRVLSIPVPCYMEWMRMDVEALFLRTQANISRLILQTAEARKYLFLEGKDRLMIHLTRKFEQRQPAPAELELKKTRNQMADEIGFSAKTLNRSISKLAQLGFIRLRRGKVVIPREGYCKMKEHLERHISVDTALRPERL